MHHYTEYMEKTEFDEAFETVNTLIKDYIHLDMLHLRSHGDGGAPGGVFTDITLSFAFTVIRCS